MPKLMMTGSTTKTTDNKNIKDDMIGPQMRKKSFEDLCWQPKTPICPILVLLVPRNSSYELVFGHEHLPKYPAPCLELNVGSLW